MKEIVKEIIDYLIIRSQLDELIPEKNEAVRKQDYEIAAKLRDDEKKLREKLDLKNSSYLLGLRNKLLD